MTTRPYTIPMPVHKLIDTPAQAYSRIRTRLINDVGPVWELINSRPYSPFWLLTRSMMPIAESIGDLIYKDDPTKNLEKLIDNDLSKIRPIYKDKGAIISLLYRHSLIHQDEPRSIYAGNITIEWNLAFIDGRHHLQTLSKDPSRRVCVMSFDLRAFYEDLLELLELYETKGPKRGVVKRYNSWTFLNFSNSRKYSATKKAEIKQLVKNFYEQA